MQGIIRANSKELAEMQAVRMAEITKEAWAVILYFDMHSESLRWDSLPASDLHGDERLVFHTDVAQA